jgi:hypothetical protein
MRFVSIIVLAAAVLIGLTQTTQSATKNYKVGELNQQVAEKKKQVEEKEFEKTRLEAIQQAASTMDQAEVQATPTLEAPKQINFLPQSSNANISQASVGKLVD